MNKGYAGYRWIKPIADHVRAPRRDVIKAALATMLFSTSATAQRHGWPKATGGEVTPEQFGAAGDGRADDTRAWQEAIGSGFPIRAKPGARYLISQPLEAKPGEALVISGTTVRGRGRSTLIAAPGFQGFLLKPSGSYDIRDLCLIGNRQDGCYLLGSDSNGSAGFATIESLDCREADILIYFGAQWQHPLGLSYNRVYGFSFRTAGIILGGARGGVSHGESAWDFRQVILTNHGNNSIGGGIAAKSVRVDRQSDTAVDKISWNTDDTREFGWVVMRSRDGHRDWHAPPNWPTTHVRAGSFSAARIDGEHWEYAVVRQTVGCCLRRGKAISIGTIQVEYCGIGLILQDVFGFSIQALYFESRDRDPVPLPAVAGLVIDHSYGTIDTAWVEHSLDGIVVVNGARIQKGIFRGNDVRRALLKNEHVETLSSYGNASEN